MVFDEKSTRDCLCVETYEDVIKQNFMLSNENEETFEEDFVEFGNSKDHKFEIKIDQVIGLGNHGEFSANLKGLPIASKVFDGSLERDGYIPTLKPKPPDEDLDEVTRHNILFTTRRMLFTSLLMYTCYNPSRYLSAHALGDPSVTVEQVTRPILSSGALFPTEERIVQLFEKNTYTVVNIFDETLRTQPNVTGVVEVPEGNGFEVVWDEQGHIVTNYHVIGNPFGFDQTLTVDIISGLNHGISGQTGVIIGGGIQTDAAINPGNSGGLFLNSKGNLIGINTAKFTQTGTSAGVKFAIPSVTVIKIVPQLIQFGKVVRVGLNVDVAPDFVANQLIVRNGAVEISLSGRVLKPNWCLTTCCFLHIPLDGRFIRRCKQGCLQFMILKPMLVMVTLILYAKGKYHDGDFSTGQSYLYLTIIYTFSYTMALYALALFYVARKELLQPFNPILKFIIIKPFVFLTYWQGVMFFLVAKSGFIKDTKEAVEFQNFIICVEMFIIAVGHLYAFPYKEYAGVNIGISRGFSGSLAHALKLNDFYHDTVHQFTPTYHDYVLCNNSDGDESSRKYRARTFVPTGPEMDTVKRNKYMFGNKINVENLSQRLAELVELLAYNTTSIVKDVYAVTTRLYDKHYKAAEYGMLLYEYRKETTIYIIDNEASTTIEKLFVGVINNIEWAEAVLTHIIMDKTFQQYKVWLLQLGIAGQGPHDFYAFFLGVHKCCLRHMDIWENSNHLCILVGTTVDALSHVFATKLGVRIVEARTNGTCALLRFDGKTQVPVEYRYDNVHIILISTQPDETITNDEIVAWSLVLDLDEIGDLSFLSDA